MKVAKIAAVPLLAILCGCYAARAYPHALPLTNQDVIRLVAEGVSEEVILSQIEATHSKFFLTVEDIVELRKSKVSDRVINHMIRTTRHPGDPW